MRIILTVLHLLMTTLLLSGCVYGTAGIYPISIPVPAPAPATIPRAHVVNAPTLEIAAPIKIVRNAIISRARARGTLVASVEPSGVVLEKTLQQSPVALVTACGAHKIGRLIRVLLGTQDNGDKTLVSEQRFIVDDGIECRLSSPDVADEAMRSLNELKRDVESKIAQR